MSDTPTPRTDALCQKLAMRPDGTYLDNIKPSVFWTMANLAKEMEADLAAKDRLLERMATALREIVPDNWEDCPELHNGRIAGEYTFGDAREARAALKEYAETTPIPLDPAPAPQ